MPAGGSARPLPGRDADDVIAQHLEDLRHAHEHRDPPRPDLPDDVVGRVAAREDDHAGQHRRHEGRHRLPEHVAERQQVQEPDRQERPRVLRYFAISRSIGTMLARMFRCVMTTPLGSAVAPDVKMISAVSSGVDSSTAARRLDGGTLVAGLAQQLRRAVQIGRVGCQRRRVDRVADEHRARIDDRRRRATRKSADAR